MKKVLLIGCVILFVFCTPRKTKVETEGLEEVIVFGEDEGEVYVIEEPVLPMEEVESSEEVAVLPPPIEEPVEEPLILEEPVEEPIVPPPVVEIEEEPYVPPPPPPIPPPVKIYGFRIQVFASSTERNASKVAEDVRTAFTENVYVEYVAPYYKVRVGDCLIHEDAEVLKNKVVRLGYYGAFIVETMITP